MCVPLQSLFAEKSQQKCSVRLAGPGREIFILKIAGSNPARSTTIKTVQYIMAHHKSAKKRIRSNEKRRVENRYYAKTMRNALRDFRALEDKAVATERLPKMVSIIDKLAKRSIIHKNKAANLKSKLMKKVNAM